MIESHHPRESATLRIPDLPAVCISSVEWDFLKQRPQHLMIRYADCAKVLFVDHPRRAGRSVILPLAKIRFRHVAPHLWSLSTHKALPFDRKFQFARDANVSILSRMIRNAMRRLEIKKHILWCYLHSSAPFVTSLKPSLTVYDCVDDWAAFYQPRKQIESEEMRLVKVSDVIFTSSRLLYEAKKQANPNTYLVPNGVDFEHFSSAARIEDVPASMASITHPIVGFSGAVHHWINLDLVADVAKHEPGWSFVFVGPIGDQVKVPHLPNMHFLGQVPYEYLPPYVAAFDVCIMPFRVTPLTESADPIKMYEYLATGKPIVSTSLPEVRKFARLIGIADGAANFRKSISLALEEDSPQEHRARQAVARENSWDSRFQTMMKIIDERRNEFGV